MKKSNFLTRKQPYPNKIQPGVYESKTLPTIKNFNRELLRIRAFWPLDFFPDELVIQEKTISIIRREFLFSYIETIPVKDIGRVILTDTPFFDSLTIIGKNTDHILEIKALTKKNAKLAKEVIDGLLIEAVGTIDIPPWTNSKTKRDILQQAGQQAQFKR